MKEKTPLEKLQAQIDRCNNHSGCDSVCSKDQQKNCPKLKAHAERIEYCREQNLDIVYW